MSHLLQMRGLKLVLKRLYLVNNSVASFTDAWIETFRSREQYLKTRVVASFTDAWIETTVQDHYHCL